MMGESDDLGKIAAGAGPFPGEREAEKLKPGCQGPCLATGVLGHRVRGLGRPFPVPKVVYSVRS
jgi:hypothetical protein